MNIKIGITGHRHLEDPAKVTADIASVLSGIIREKDSRFFEAYSGIAYGADTIFAEEILKRNIALHAVIPFSKKEFRKDFEKAGPGATADFDRLSTHNPVIITEAVPANEAERKTQYFEAGKKIVDTCDILVAVWDGKGARKKDAKKSNRGGTADVVRYARERGKTIIHIEAYRSELSRLYIQKERQAKAFKRLYNFLWRTGLLLSLFAALILAVSISFHFSDHVEWMLAMMELACVGVTWLMVLIIKFAGIKRKRMEYRRQAEWLRVLNTFYNGQLPLSEMESTKTLSKDFAALEAKYMALGPASPNAAKATGALLELAEKQIHYHTSSRPGLKSKMIKGMEQSKNWLTGLFTLGVLLHFMAIYVERNHETNLPHIPHWMGLLLSLSIPPLYAAIEGFIHFNETHKLKNDSKKMFDYFTHLKPQIEAIDPKNTQAHDTLKRFADSIRETMDSETKDWIESIARHGLVGPVI